MTILDAYRAAKPAFVSTDGVIDGIPHRVISDPGTGLRMAVPVKDAGLLPWLFKSRWIAAHSVAPGGNAPLVTR